MHCPLTQPITPHVQRHLKGAEKQSRSPVSRLHVTERREREKILAALVFGLVLVRVSPSSGTLSSWPEKVGWPVSGVKWNRATSRRIRSAAGTLVESISRLDSIWSDRSGKTSETLLV